MQPPLYFIQQGYSIYLRVESLAKDIIFTDNAVSGKSWLFFLPRSLSVLWALSRDGVVHTIGQAVKSSWKRPLKRKVAARLDLLPPYRTVYDSGIPQSPSRHIVSEYQIWKSELDLLSREEEEGLGSSFFSFFFFLFLFFFWGWCLEGVEDVVTD